MWNHYRRAGIHVVDLGSPDSAVGDNKFASKVHAFKRKVQRLKQFIRRNGIDILDVHLSPANPTGAIAALNSGIPFVVTLYQPPVLECLKFWLAEQVNLGAAACLITDSHAQASRIRRWLLANPDVRVIPNGTAAPRPSLPRNEVLEFFNIPEDPNIRIIGQISGLISYKGHEVLLQAAKEVLATAPKAWFLLVGYDRDQSGRRERLLRYAAELGIAERVRILGYPGNIGDVWNIIDIHAHASLLDSLPNALLEAMSLAKPSVVTSVGGIPEAVTHGLNGLLVPPEKPDELARQLTFLLREPALAKKLGTAAHDTYLQRYQPQKMTRRLEECFSSMLG